MHIGWTAAFAAGLLALAGSGEAQTPRGFLELGVVDGDTIGFMDTASITTGGPAGEYDYISVPPPGSEVVYERFRVRVDCRTRLLTFVRGRSFATVAGQGVDLDSAELNSGEDVEASDEMVDLLCGRGRLPEDGEYAQSLQAAIALARARQAEIAERTTPPPAFQLRFVRRSEFNGQPFGYYIDLASADREGDVAAAWILAVYDAPISTPQAPDISVQSALFLVTVDCVQGQISIEAAWFYAPNGDVLTGRAMSGEQSRAEGEAAAQAEMACGPPRTNGTELTSLAAARADARRRR